MMNHSLSSVRKNTLRFLAWGCLFAVLFAAGSNLASAQDRLVVVEEVPTTEGTFLEEVLRSIFTFDTRGLLRVFGQPRYAIPAFIALNVIVFVETGLLIGFFLPGDSLLVVTGLICASPDCQWNLPLLLVTLCISAIVGDTLGYWIGLTSGPKIFNKEKSWFFNKDHLLKAQQFYERHGGKTIILARFMPILRTFAPVVAGVGKMNYRQFLFFNVIGGIGWVVSMILVGYYLPALLNPILRPLFGQQFHVAYHVEKVVIIVVFLSIAPGIFAWLKSKLTGKTETRTEAAKPDATTADKAQDPPLAA